MKDPSGVLQYQHQLGNHDERRHDLHEVPQPDVPLAASVRAVLDAVARSDRHADQAFVVCDVAKMRNNCNDWRGQVPHAKPVFDVFANGNAFILKTLSDLGCAFRVRSREDVELAVSAGIDPADLRMERSEEMHAYVASHLKAAAAKRVATVVAFHEDDLKKIARFHPNCSVLLSLGSDLDDDDSNGAVSAFLRLSGLASELGLSVCGVALRNSVCLRRVFALASLAPNCGNTIDLGFLQQDCACGCGQEASSLLAWLSLDLGLSVFALSGDALVDNALTLVAKILARRDFKDGDQQCATYVINDGVFGTCARMLCEDDVAIGRPFAVNKSRATRSPVRVSVWGPSGDDLDVLFDAIEMSEEMDEDDWMAFGNAAAAMAGAASAHFDVFQAENEDDIWVLVKRALPEDDLPSSTGTCRDELRLADDVSDLSLDLLLVQEMAAGALTEIA